MTKDDFKLSMVLALVTAGTKSPSTAFNTAEEFAKIAERKNIEFSESTGPIMNVTSFVDGRTEVKTVSQKKPTMQEVGINVCKGCTLCAKCKEPERSKNIKDMRKLCVDAYERYINR